MSKFKFKFKLTGLEIEAEGDRRDMPNVSTEIGKQLGALITPPAYLLDEPVRKQVDSTVVPETTSNETLKRRQRSSGTSSRSKVESLSWQHDPGKWGNPKQSWSAGEKVAWMLWVVENELGQKDFEAALIAATFTSKFKEFGTILSTSMPSIMGSLKKSNPALAGDDNSKSPKTWHLTDAGKKEAERLVTAAKSPA